MPFGWLVGGVGVDDPKPFAKSGFAADGFGGSIIGGATGFAACVDQKDDCAPSDAGGAAFEDSLGAPKENDGVVDMANCTGSAELENPPLPPKGLLGGGA